MSEGMGGEWKGEMTGGKKRKLISCVENEKIVEKKDGKKTAKSPPGKLYFNNSVAPH